MTRGERRLRVVHVPMAQGNQHSTLLAVAERLCEAYQRAGGDAAVALAHSLTTDGARTVPVHYGSVRFSERELKQDVVLGRLGRTRPHFGHVYDPAIAAAQADPPDLVLLYEGHYAATSLPQWQLLRDKGTRVHLYVHNQLSRSYGRTELRRLFGHADRVVFVSEHQRADAEARLGARHGIPLDVVPNGVDERFRAPRPRRRPGGEFVVTFVGNVVPGKGPHLAIQAADAASRIIGRPFRVQVVGDSWYGYGGQSPYETWLRQQCATIATPVDFLPRVSKERVVEVFGASSAGCFPSEVESLPTALLEAMAAALPVVCSDIPGMREAGGDAVLAHPREDIAGLAESLAELADDPQVWADRSRRVWERAKQFSWDAAAAALART